MIQTGAKNTISFLYIVSFCHCLNDLIQSLLPAIYPIISQNYHLNYTQLGLLTLIYQLTASILQPCVGLYTDKYPKPYSLCYGMICSVTGLLLLSFSHHYWGLLSGAACLGLGSSIFHPESSRIARIVSGNAHGLAQSIFQIGGNLGMALGPLVAAWIISPLGQKSLAFFSILGLIGLFLTIRVGTWYKGTGHNLFIQHKKSSKKSPFKPVFIYIFMFILMTLIFSKYVYMASITNYYTLYLISHFSISIQSAQICLFAFFASIVAGTLIGGALGDHFGRRIIIIISILGIVPFTLMLPYVNLTTTIIFSIFIGFILSSAFPSIIVYAQELVPGKTGMISGIFYGLTFGIGGISAALLGTIADKYSIDFVYKICSYLPLIGIIALFLPSLGRQKALKKNHYKGSN